MQRLLFTLVILFFPFTLLAEPQTYKLDPGHTYVMWRISHFGFSNPSGKWYANGTLILDENKPQDSKLDVMIDVASVNTGIPKLDEHLRAKAFFDTEKFPTATFVSEKITLLGKGKAKVQGILTLRGVSKPVTLEVQLNGIAMSPITSKKTAGFSATGKLNRSDFGMTTLSPGLGDEVKLDIEAEATLE